ncbi:hypothetical protein PAPYR_11364 [Paratrimastix pyriformis]|uniref:Uncharacterized protein n=1 Tax=Paratrimastix pyriformis TaxID=342808 RepID=A0ABQ8U6S0_9EUKA|nr:hypothetical protein PAPYR_11364 [Paratrimastix pyriformis]
MSSHGLPSENGRIFTSDGSELVCKTRNFKSDWVMTDLVSDQMDCLSFPFLELIPCALFHPLSVCFSLVSAKVRFRLDCGAHSLAVAVDDHDYEVVFTGLPAAKLYPAATVHKNGPYAIGSASSPTPTIPSDRICLESDPDHPESGATDDGGGTGGDAAALVAPTVAWTQGLAGSQPIKWDRTRLDPKILRPVLPRLGGLSNLAKDRDGAVWGSALGAAGWTEGRHCWMVSMPPLATKLLESGCQVMAGVCRPSDFDAGVPCAGFGWGVSSEGTVFQPLGRGP